MNSSPVTVFEGSSPNFILDQMKEKNVLGIQVLNNKGKFVKIVHFNDLTQKNETKRLENKFDFAVIMAGGEGTRLRPITLDIPKPMVKVGGVPLIERQVEKLIKTVGLNAIYFCKLSK